MAKKRCHFCKVLFTPDLRVGDRQRTCSKECQRLRKRENNRAFSLNNPGYWYGRYEYVKEWRRLNPCYQRLWRQGKKEEGDGIPRVEIQAEILGKALDGITKGLILLRKIQAEIFLKTLDIPVKRHPLIF